MITVQISFQDTVTQKYHNRSTTHQNTHKTFYSLYTTDTPTNLQPGKRTHTQTTDTQKKQRKEEKWKVNQNEDKGISFFVCSWKHKEEQDHLGNSSSLWCRSPHFC